MLIFLASRLLSAQDSIMPPTITLVTVESTTEYAGAVRIYWNASTTPGVKGYVLFREINDETHSGYQIVTDEIDGNENSYLDTLAQGNIKSESYKMAAYIIDKNKYGPSGKAHNTIYLRDVKFDSCKMTHTLTWNHYTGWGSEVKYNIYANGSEIKRGYSDTTDVIENVQFGNYSYSVHAIKNKSTSTSNTVTSYTTPMIAPDTSLLYIKQISYDGSSVSFVANIDTSADLLGHSLMVSSSENLDFKEIAFVDFSDQDETIDFSHSAEGQPLLYKVNAIGLCKDKVAETPVVQPIVLTAESDGTKIKLSWNASYIQSLFVNYNLTSTVDGIAVPLTQPSGKSANYLFDDLGTETSEVFCFSVEAEMQGNTSSSNEVCVSRVPKIKVPTAFSPNGDGLNDYFGPFWKEGEENNKKNYIKNTIVEDFKLIIYNKYGGSIYVSNKSESKWAGDVNGRFVPEGGYIYYLWYKTSQGKSYEKSGSINVVYP